MKRSTLICILLFLSICGKAQITIGSLKDPNKGAVLDLDVTDKGLKFPNVTLNMSDLSDFALVGSDEEEVVQSAVGMVVYNIAEGAEGLYVWTGAKWDKIGDTTKVEESEKKLKKEFDSLIKKITSSEMESLRLPIPTVPARVEFSGDIDWTKISKDDAIEVKITYNDFQGNYFEKKALVTYQGDTSIEYPKKNFVIDLLNDNKKSCDVKFGNWVATDSYHLKANYIDYSQARNLAIARLALQVSEARPRGKRFPWDKEYNPSNAILIDRFDSGAKGVVDGFPMELYINGEYWGLYTFNLKKQRKNFNMKKNEATKIAMAAGGNNTFTAFVPLQWEFKNPDPVTTETLNAVQRIFSWMNKVSKDNSIFLAEYEQYWNKNEWVDYYILMQLFFLSDCMYKNMMFCTWDGLRWQPKLYDLDTSFGLVWTGKGIISDSEVQWLNGNDFRTPWDLVLKFWEPDIAERYRELRKTILTEENVEKAIKSITDVFGVENYEKDAKRWPDIPSNSPQRCYTGLNQMMDWYAKRVAWLDEQWAVP